MDEKNIDIKKDKRVITVLLVFYVLSMMVVRFFVFDEIENYPEFTTPLITIILAVFASVGGVMLYYHSKFTELIRDGSNINSEFMENLDNLKFLIKDNKNLEDKAEIIKRSETFESSENSINKNFKDLTRKYSKDMILLGLIISGMLVVSIVRVYLVYDESTWGDFILIIIGIGVAIGMFLDLLLKMDKRLHMLLDIFDSMNLFVSNIKNMIFEIQNKK